MSWVSTVLGAAQRLGLAPQALLAHASIPLADLKAQRWPIDHITRLWRAAATLTQDAGFGLKAGSQVGPASFNVVSYILQSSATLRESIAVAQKFQRLISDGGRFQMITGEQSSWIVYHPLQGELAFSPHQLEAVLSAVVSVSRWVTGSSMNPLRAQFSHAVLGPLSGYQAVFHCPVDFEQAFSGLLLDNATLDQPLPQADAQLTAVHQQHAALRLAALSEESTADLTTQLRGWLADQLGQALPGRAQAAQAFGMSERSLARRLQGLELSYTHLLDAARKEHACQSVAHTQRAFTDIAQSLGFAEASTFNRAFKRWTGRTPGEYRRIGGGDQ